jgi:hypothetical protein
VNPRADTVRVSRPGFADGHAGSGTAGSGRRAAAITGQQMSDPSTVYSCIAALGPDIPICRGQLRREVARCE